MQYLTNSLFKEELILNNQEVFATLSILQGLLDNLEARCLLTTICSGQLEVWSIHLPNRFKSMITKGSSHIFH